MKLTNVALLVLLALASNHFLAGDETRSGLANKLVPLKIEHEKIAAEFGANHPRVKQLDRRIELTTKLLSHPDTTEELLPLQVERETAAAEFGPNHPRVKQLDREIELTRRFLSESDDSREGNVLRPTELLAVLQNLIERVDLLESELATLKARTPAAETR